MLAIILAQEDFPINLLSRAVKNFGSPRGGEQKRPFQKKDFPRKPPNWEKRKKDAFQKESVL
ncbi:hypothetical protein [uncultured Neglectibacter sp.]|uniref:hypothetical protein n=1 Tax=uncultured Neglectibacter sp. TaxID=1924108 RepID=UPI0034DF2414